jgi:hypothetical protein
VQLRQLRAYARPHFDADVEQDGNDSLYIRDVVSKDWQRICFHLREIAGVAESDSHACLRSMQSSFKLLFCNAIRMPITTSRISPAPPGPKGKRCQHRQMTQTDLWGILALVAVAMSWALAAVARCWRCIRPFSPQPSGRE